VAVFIDGQNLYFRCKDHFSSPWIDPLKLGQALVAEDQAQYGPGSHVLECVRYYTGIHEKDRNAVQYEKTTARLAAFEADGVGVVSLPLRYDPAGRPREKGIDVRLAIDMIRYGRDGLFDVAIVVTEDSDIDEAVQDLYALRNAGKWLAVENALPYSGKSGVRNPRWLPSVKRKRRITTAMFAMIEDSRHF